MIDSVSSRIRQKKVCWTLVH